MTSREDDYAFGALGAGASGFLLKDVRAAELHRAIRAVAAGDAVLMPRVTRQVLERGVPRGLPARQRERARRMVDALTLRELDIVRLIADGLSNAEIARRLVLELASVRRNVNRILAKLGLRDRVQIAVAWHRAGCEARGAASEPDAPVGWSAGTRSGGLLRVPPHRHADRPPAPGRIRLWCGQGRRHETTDGCAARRAARRGG